MHDELVAELAPRALERWLDVACGVGSVAFRAAAAGAAVTGVDIADGMLEKARAAADGAAVEFVLGDAQALPFADASFDVVSSCFGVAFAPDADAAAAELARVCGAGGRLALSSWAPQTDLDELFRRFSGRPPLPERWSTEESVRELLEPAFDVRVETRTFAWPCASADLLWELFSTSIPPVVALRSSLGSEREAELGRAFVETHEPLPNGFPRDYLLVLGARR